MWRGRPRPRFFILGPSIVDLPAARSVRPREGTVVVQSGRAAPARVRTTTSMLNSRVRQLCRRHDRHRSSRRGGEVSEIQRVLSDHSPRVEGLEKCMARRTARQSLRALNSPQPCGLPAAIWRSSSIQVHCSWNAVFVPSLKSQLSLEYKEGCELFFQLSDR